uniref:Uncharacterized protein n=1 Tax=Ascaris lumbricoides TaxID=6252 RepID=A0A0M3HWP4_ASCLU
MLLNVRWANTFPVHRRSSRCFLRGTKLYVKHPTDSRVSAKDRKEIEDFEKAMKQWSLLNLHERFQPSLPSFCNEPSESNEKQNHINNAIDKMIWASSGKAEKVVTRSPSQDGSRAWTGSESRKRSVAVMWSRTMDRIYEELLVREQIPFGDLLHNPGMPVHPSVHEYDNVGYFNEMNHIIPLRSTKENNMDPKRKNSRDRSKHNVEFKIADDDGGIPPTIFAFSILCTILFAIM